MMPHHSDSAVLTFASRSFVGECLKAGIRILLYEGGMLHSKMMLVDDEFSTVGSANVDFRSFEHNFEGNIMVYGADLNAELRRRFTDAQSRSTRVRATDWGRRPLPHKITESIVRLLSPIL
ncbi:MAG: cardiolipin synthase, partial [Muribaculaceae bacterium]|nr:cardiolipin synthase [Muribaculaceae bacterium]